MAFSDNLKAARKQAFMTQKELAEAAGVSWRAIQTWEAGRLPRSLDPVMKLSDVLGTTPQALLSEADTYAIDSAENGSGKVSRDVDELVSEIIGLFAGGDIDEEEKDGIMAALNEAYWIAKNNNTRYAPKKYRKK